jgi:hypothetical protein
MTENGYYRIMLRLTRRFSILAREGCCGLKEGFRCQVSGVRKDEDLTISIA